MRWSLLWNLLRKLLRNFRFHTSTVVPVGACAHVLLGVLMQAPIDKPNFTYEAEAADREVAGLIPDYYK